MRICVCKISDFEDFNGLSLLSKERQAKVSSYLKKEDKLRCLCGGLLIRFLFGNMANKVITNEYGKPYLPNCDLFFNLSHAGDYVVLVADTQEIGVDIENIRTLPKSIINKCFTLDEQEWLNRQISKQAFYMLWTAKESAMKAIGKGFYMSPKIFSVMPIKNGLHYIANNEWYLQWYCFCNHVICITSKTDERAKICYLKKKDLTKI